MYELNKKKNNAPHTKHCPMNTIMDAISLSLSLSLCLSMSLSAFLVLFRLKKSFICNYAIRCKYQFQWNRQKWKHTEKENIWKTQLPNTKQIETSAEECGRRKRRELVLLLPLWAKLSCAAVCDYKLTILHSVEF